MKIAINGMGRIGRLLFRRLVSREGIEIVGVNDIMDPQNLAYLLQYDSVYGKFELPVIYKQKLFIGNDTEVNCFSEPDPLKLPWKKLNVDVVLECTGGFTLREMALQHLQAGAKKSVIVYNRLKRYSINDFRP